MVLVKDSKTKDERNPGVKERGVSRDRHWARGCQTTQAASRGLEWMERHLQVLKPQGLKHHTVLQTQVWAGWKPE